MSKKTILCLLPILLSFNVNSKLLEKEDYKKIKETFVSEAKEQGGDVTVLSIQDYAKITEKEKNDLNSLKEETEGSPTAIIEYALNGYNFNNLALLEANDNKTTWVMPLGMEPNGFYENNCTYLQMIGNNEDCLSMYPQLKENIKDFLNYHDIKINEEYMSDFYFIHELTHLLPNQKELPAGVDVTRIWVDDINTHYAEMYSDLFAAIFLNNFLGYSSESLANIVQFRDFNLTANDDLRHYSTPYIEEMLKSKDWLSLKSFEEINKYIEKIYLKVNREKIISKKEYKMVHHKNFVWCNEMDISLFKSKEELEMIIYHCKKMKKH